jgi:uncharacterized membrane protein
MRISLAQRWRLPLLIGSLLLNLLLLGIVAGHLLLERRPAFPPGDFATRVSRGMSEEDAKVMAAAFRPVEELRDHMRQGRALIGRSRELLKEPSFDTEAFAQLIREASRDREEFDQRFSAALVQAARELTPEGRKILANHRP